MSGASFCLKIKTCLPTGTWYLFIENAENLYIFCKIHCPHVYQGTGEKNILHKILLLFCCFKCEINLPGMFFQRPNSKNLSRGLNLPKTGYNWAPPRRLKSWKILYNFKWNQPYFSRGLNLSRGSNSLNSAFGRTFLGDLFHI